MASDEKKLKLSDALDFSPEANPPDVAKPPKNLPKVSKSSSLDRVDDAPGESIDGRTNLGRAIMIHVRRLGHSPESELRRVADGHDQPLAARLAAQWLQRCMTTLRTSSGHFLASGEVQHLLDRTLGKPAANYNVQSESKSLHLIAMTEDAEAALDALTDE